MLSCRTDSAKLKHPGGPVSEPWISTAIRTGRAKIVAVYSRNPMSCGLNALTATYLATTARRSLQQGVWEPGSFLTGAECIGHESAPDSESATILPRAQWFQ